MERSSQVPEVNICSSSMLIPSALPSSTNIIKFAMKSRVDDLSEGCIGEVGQECDNYLLCVYDGSAERGEALSESLKSS